MFASIKLKLVAWLFVVFSVVFTMLGFLLYYQLRDVVFAAIDEHAYSEVTLLAGILAEEAQHGHLEEGIMELSAAATGEYSVALSGHYYQMTDKEGIVLGRSPSLSLADKFLPSSPVTWKPVYDTITGPEGTPLRIITQTFDYSSFVITFQAADSLEDSYYVLRSFRNIILIALPAIFFVSLTGILYISGVALRPINLFSEKIGHITERNLKERVDDTSAVQELKPLAENFNTMLARLEKSFTRQREFLSDASHELRTPTSVIKSQCDVTIRKERSVEEYREALTNIGKTAAKMGEILNRILEASRLESKIFHLKIEQVDLREVVADTIKLMIPAANEHGITLGMSGGSVKVHGDRERLYEVFVNLVDNAVKYTPEGGRVDVKIEETGIYADVSVIDTGIGMSEKVQGLVFERFYRADSSREEVSGSGLGLPIVKAILDAHQAKIEIRSEIGKGSTFKVSLLKG